MPELPEVETIVRELSRALTGKKLRHFLVFDNKKIARPRLSLPQKIVSVSRHGKYIVCGTDMGLRCLVHLRMTGELLLERNKPRAGAPVKKSKHERAAFSFSDGSVLRFHDVRRFGTIEWLEKQKPLPSLGLEPLSGGFTPKTLSMALKNSSRAIKSTLLDQRKVAGVGNIYADESLWVAKIDPKRGSNTLNSGEVRKLVLSLGAVLREAIKKGGFTLRDYRRIDGRLGSYQHSRKVYGREGEKCLRCNAKIKRIKIGGRSSYFCPKCQK